MNKKRRTLTFILAIFLIILISICFNKKQSAPINKLEKEFYTFLIDNGFSSEQASGITANIIVESNFDCNATDFNNIGYGLLQWSMHRKENLETFSTILGKPINSLETQLLFMLEELNPESEFYQLLPSYKGYISSDFLQATTPRQAAESFCFLYTRADCTPENLNLRCNLAQKIYNTYN